LDSFAQRACEISGIFKASPKIKSINQVCNIEKASIPKVCFFL
jgi:hypothetical protein